VKLKLNLDQLSVDTFETTTVEKKKGTVFGEQCTCWTRCGQNTCPGCPTCDASCNGTCVNSCAHTCAYTCDDASCAGTCGASCNGTCDYSCGATQCEWGYTCGDCTALQTNCNQICL
jgi:hypothetical protein